jgi:hypothetical protein
MPSKRTHIYQLKITLLGTKPRVWRRLLIPSELALGELHHIIQIAMGWTNSHLHMFKTDTGAIYGDKAADDDGMLGFKDEWAVDIGKILRQPRQTMIYEYDFGDGWEHEVLLEKQIPLIGDQAAEARCLDGAGACPPEDVGGVPGFQHFLEVINDPAHPEHQDMASWYGEPRFDPNAVDIDLINECLDEPSAFALGPDFSEFANESFTGSLGSLSEKLNEHISQCEFGTEEELQEIIAGFMQEQDHEPAEVFGGLSPEQMHELLYSTFAAPDLLQWQLDAVDAAKAPVLRLVQALFEQLHAGKLKLTSKGNLQLATIRQIWAESGLEGPLTRGTSKLRSEEDVLPLHIARLLAEIGGYTTATRTALDLSDEGRELFESGQWSTIYLRLLVSAFQEFNWHYLGGDELPSLQATAPFGLWLLHQFGQEWRDTTFYANHMADAFPTIVDELPPNDFISQEMLLDILVNTRLFAILKWFGLVEERALPSSKANTPSMPINQVRATPFFRELLAWKV